MFCSITFFPKGPEEPNSVCVGGSMYQVLVHDRNPTPLNFDWSRGFALYLSLNRSQNYQSSSGHSQTDIPSWPPAIQILHATRYLLSCFCSCVLLQCVPKKCVAPSCDLCPGPGVGSHSTSVIRSSTVGYPICLSSYPGPP